MLEVKNWEAVANIIGRWDPGDLAFLTSLCYDTSENEQSKDLVIGFFATRRDLALHGWPDPNMPQIAITIKFMGIDDLRITGFGSHNPQLMGFDIVDASHEGRENRKYFVEDYENGRLSFYCETVEILMASRIT